VVVNSPALERDSGPIGRLAGLGLTANQARAYVALLRGGAAGASELAARAAVPRPKVYEALHALERLGLCAPGGNRVARWEAVPPETALPGLLAQRERERRGEAVREERVCGELIAELPRAPRVPSTDGTPLLEALIGRARIAEAFERLIAQAQSQLDIVQAAPMVQDRRRWNRFELAAIGRGVEVRLLCTPETASDPARYADLVDGGGQARVSERLALKLAIRDYEEVLVALTDPAAGPGRPEVTAMLILQPDLVAPLVALFRRSWRQGSRILPRTPRGGT